MMSDPGPSRATFRRSPYAHATPISRSARGMSVASSPASAPALFALVALLVGCWRAPEPAALAESGAAYTTVAGVAVRAKTGWRGESGVEELVTPVYIEIDNGSRERLRIRYSSLSLQSRDGKIFPAMPPLDVRRTVRAATSADGLNGHGRALPPRPTRYMGQVALPEACVPPGGTLSGFVYFERVPPSNDRVMLNVELVNAGSSEVRGVARIPVEID